MDSRVSEGKRWVLNKPLVLRSFEEKGFFGGYWEGVAYEAKWNQEWGPKGK